MALDEHIPTQRLYNEEEAVVRADAIKEKLSDEEETPPFEKDTAKRLAAIKEKLTNIKK